MAPSHVRAPPPAAELLCGRDRERQRPGLSPPPAAPRCQDRAAAGIRGQRRGPGREGRGGLAVLPPARGTKPALVRGLGCVPWAQTSRGPLRPARAAGRPDRAGKGTCRLPRTPAGAALCQGSWGPARGSARPWTAGPRPRLRGPPAGGSRAHATYAGGEGALVTVTPAAGLDGGAGGGGAEEDLGASCSDLVFLSLPRPDSSYGRQISTHPCPSALSPPRAPCPPPTAHYEERLPFANAWQSWPLRAGRPLTLRGMGGVAHTRTAPCHGSRQPSLRSLLCSDLASLRRAPAGCQALFQMQRIHGRHREQSRPSVCPQGPHGLTPKPVPSLWQ